MPDGLKATLMVALVIAVMFRPFWRILGFTILIGFRVLKWVMIVGLIAGLANSKQMYNWLGFTPFSLIMGKEIYNNVHAEEDYRNGKEIRPETADSQQPTLPDDRHQRHSKRTAVTGR